MWSFALGTQSIFRSPWSELVNWWVKLMALVPCSAMFSVIGVGYKAEVRMLRAAGLKRFDGMRLNGKIGRAPGLAAPTGLKSWPDALLHCPDPLKVPPLPVQMAPKSPPRSAVVNTPKVLDVPG